MQESDVFSSYRGGKIISAKGEVSGCRTEREE